MQYSRIDIDYSRRGEVKRGIIKHKGFDIINVLLFCVMCIVIVYYFIA